MLVLGGAKSGKSTFALDLCNALEKKRIFLATAEGLDGEMEERIRRHRSERGNEWQTVEEPLEVAAAIGEVDGKDRVILLDCLTLWLGNLYMKYGEDQEAVEREMENLLKELSGVVGPVVVVSNEAGMGIVPQDPLTRRYRDTLGRLNQGVARIARKVVVLMAGLPLVLKDETITKALR